MDNKITEKVFSYIDALAQKLGVAVEYVLTILVQQKFLEGIVYSSVFILASIFIGIVAFKVIKYVTKNWDDLYQKDTEFGWGAISIILGIAVIILFVLDLTVLPDYIMQIFNPKYYAIKEILNTLK
jgi:hypothetical protein